MNSTHAIPADIMRRELMARRYANGGAVGVSDVQSEDLPEDTSARRDTSSIPSLQDPNGYVPSMSPDRARGMREMLEASIKEAAMQAKIQHEEAAALAQEAAHKKTEDANAAVAQAQVRADAAKAKLVELLQARASIDSPQPEQDDPMARIREGISTPEMQADIDSQREDFQRKMELDDQFSADRKRRYADWDAGVATDIELKAGAEEPINPTMVQSLGGQHEMPYDPLDPVFNPNSDPNADMRAGALQQDAQATPQDQIQGPLQQVATEQPQASTQQAQIAPVAAQNALPVSQQPEAAPAAPMPVEAPLTGMQKIMNDYREKKSALESRQEEILKGLEDRIGSPSGSWLALAKGFGAPNQTGAFGNAFGSAMGSLSDYREKNIEQARELAKMRMELAKANLTGNREDVGMSMMGDLMAPVRSTSGAPVVSASGENVTARGGLQNVTAEHLAQLSMFNPGMAKALEAAIKMDMERYGISANGMVFDKRAGKFITEIPPFQEQKEYNIPGKGTFKMRPADYDRLMQANTEGRGEEEFNRIMRPLSSGAEAAVPQAVRGAPPEQGGVLSEEEKTIRATEKKAEAEARGKSAAATREDIYAAGRNSFNTRQNAEAIMYLAQSHPKAFGPLAKPGFWSAILGAAQEGISLGSIGKVGISGLSDAIVKLGGTQADIDAGQAAARYMTELELSYRRTYLQGQGAVSNMEGEIIKKVGPSTSDSPKTLMVKAELIKDRALFDAENRRVFADWEQKNPGKSMSQYESSPEFNKIRNELDKKMGRIYKQYFAQKAEGKKAQQQQEDNPTAQSLKALIKQFEEEERGNVQ